MMTISNLDFLHYMTAVSHEMSDEPKILENEEASIRGALVMR